MKIQIEIEIMGDLILDDEYSFDMYCYMQSDNVEQEDKDFRDIQTFIVRRPCA